MLSEQRSMICEEVLGFSRELYVSKDCKWVLGIPYTELRQESYNLDLSSVIWFTYRSGFPTLAPYPQESDSGWGCMLRCAQMLMAQGLQRHYLHRNWRWPQSCRERASSDAYCTLVRWFADHPGPRCPYSLHNICQIGLRHDRLPGEWYGPGAAACVLRDLSIAHALSTDDSPSILNINACALKVHVAPGGAVFDSDLDVLAAGAAKAQVEVKNTEDNELDPLQRPPDPPPKWECSILLIVTLRLGLDSFNRDYIPALRHMLQLPCTLGFLGGKPNLAMYFIGISGDTLTCLDPHTTQAALSNPEIITPAYCETTMCKYPASMDFNRLDPSLALAFYLKSRLDLSHLKEVLDILQEKGYLIPFTIEAAPPNYECTAVFGTDDDVHSDGQMEDSYVLI